MEKIALIEAHFADVASQSSIYGLTSLQTGGNSHKVLMATSKRKVYCVEYSDNQGVLIPSTREVQFTYIPGSAEIISIDSFNQTSDTHNFVVGITFIKSDGSGNPAQYLNIYSDKEPNNVCDLDNIAQRCLSIGLNFIPFHLTHTELYIDGSKEMVWLLSGSDCQVHLYREDKSRQIYCEEPSKVYFPEFEGLSSVSLWIDFIVSNSSRVTAIGCKDGSIFVSIVKFKPDINIHSSWKIEHDGPIAVVKLFYDSNDKIVVKSSQGDNDIDIEALNLLVVNTLEVSVVYRAVLKKGLNLSSQLTLPESNKFDAATCGIIADINMDGYNELLLGTYGQELLIYKWHQEDADSKGSYVLIHQQSFPNPLLALNYIDITGDVLNELLVLTTKGLHIMQHKLEDVVNLTAQRLQILDEISEENLNEFLEQFCKL